MTGAEPAVEGTPFWFGSDDRPLFGWWHRPSGGKARGTVILCPPLGIEAICVYFTLRLLAERLAERGLAVLRFDYDGTGDSMGSDQDPDRVPAWERSVTEAVLTARGLGTGPVALGGIRMGALFAARAAARDVGGPVDALVLWDPCTSGTAFLREQRALRLLSIGGGEASGAVDGPGIRFEPATVAAMDDLTLPAGDAPRAGRILVLEDPARRPSSRLARWLGPGRVDCIPAEGQSELLDPPRQTPPQQTVGRVADWIAAALAGPGGVVGEPRSSGAVRHDDSPAGPILEQAVAIGPGRLFGVISEPTPSGPDSSRSSPLGPGPARDSCAPGSERPSVVLVDEGNTPHIGQSRMWVELARSWAGRGFRTLRFDLAGNGDSPPRPGAERHEAWSPEAYDDVVDACRAASPDDPGNVVLVGLCSGAYQAMEVALGFPVRGVFLVNPGVAFVGPEERTRRGQTLDRPARRLARQTTASVPRALTEPLIRKGAGRFSPGRADDLDQALRTGTWAKSLAARAPWIPDATWRVTVAAVLRGHPVSTFERLVDQGTCVDLFCGATDRPGLELGARRRLARLRKNPRFDLIEMGALDHAALAVAARAALMDALSAALVRRYEPGSPSAPSR